MPEFGIALCFLCAGALLLNHSPMRRTAFIMLANWCACEAFVRITGNHEAWPWFWAMDLVAASAVLVHPLGRAQQIIGGIYGVMIGWHTMFAITGDDPAFYLNGLDWFLLAQMAVMILWGAGHAIANLGGFHRLNPFHYETHQ